MRACFCFLFALHSAYASTSIMRTALRLRRALLLCWVLCDCVVLCGGLTCHVPVVLSMLSFHMPASRCHNSVCALLVALRPLGGVRWLPPSSFLWFLTSRPLGGVRWSVLWIQFEMDVQAWNLCDRATKAVRMSLCARGHLCRLPPPCTSCHLGNGQHGALTFPISDA